MQKRVNLVEEFNFGRVGSIEIDADEGGDPYVMVSFDVPVPGLANTAHVEEVFYINRGRHRKMRTIVNALYQEIEDSIKEGRNVQGDPCAVCNSNCCSHFADGIFVTHEDVERICEWMDAEPKDYFIPVRANDRAIYGRTLTKLVKGTEYCIFFNEDKRNCGVHRVKPQVCRDYSPHNCQLRTIDKLKLVRLEKKKSNGKSKKRSR